MSATLPEWAERMRELFRSGAVSQFILHGNVFDVVAHAGAGTTPGLNPGAGASTKSGAGATAVEKAAAAPADHRLPQSLKQFLNDVMFGAYDVVLHYDRGHGIRALKGGEDWGEWLQQLGAGASIDQTRPPAAALELIDRYLLRSLHLQAMRGTSRRIAVMIEFAEFVVPNGDPLQLGGDFSANVVKVLSWANDPAILQANIVTVLIAEALNDVNDLVTRNPHAAALHVALPNEAEMRAHIDALIAGEWKDLPARCEVSIETLARRLTGLSRVGARTAVNLALRNEQKITSVWLSRIKKETIERECQGLIEFLESPYTLESVAGHDAVKAWLREDAELLKRGALQALPMGYLIAGRIGTGKTFIVSCWAGELGIPCVVLKNFRDRWVGATESNLEKIFAILRALGQVVVFVDEADQAAGKREGGSSDSGLSGRVYGMLAKEMSDTRNRGRILWVFATSRPDLLEVDLKRQGRLDVHIPLFPPETAGEVRVMLMAMARKLKAPMTEADIPPIDDPGRFAGSELEGVLVRALRAHTLAPPPAPPFKDTLAAVLAEVRPNANTRKLEYMDMVAVKECTDARFLPARYRDLSLAEIERRIEDLRPYI